MQEIKNDKVDKCRSKSLQYQLIYDIRVIALKIIIIREHTPFAHLLRPIKHLHMHY